MSTGTTSGYSHKLNDPKYVGEKTSKEFTDGPTLKRNCTDILFLIIFAIFWVGMIFIGMYAYRNGNPSQLIVPYDAGGNPCGQGVNIGYNYLYFTNPTPETLNQTVCVSTCPTNETQILNCNPNVIVTNCNGYDVQIYSTISSKCINLFDAYSLDFFIVDQLCYPNNTDLENYVDEIVYLGDLNEGFQDIQTTWSIILITGVIALGVGFIYMGLLRYCAGVFTWFVIIAYMIGLLAIGILFLQHANGNGSLGINGYTMDTSTEKIIAYFAFGIFAISLLILLCNFNRIRLAIAVLKCAAEFVRDVPESLIIPPIFFIISVAFFVFWIFTTVYIIGLTSEPTGQVGGLPFDHFQWTNQIIGFFGYYLFGLFWNYMFLLFLPQFILASATIIWYFCNSEGKKPDRPILRGFSWAFLYHSGSIVLGALIIAIIEMIKFIVEMIYTRLKSLQGDSMSSGEAIGFAMKATNCCLNCFERFIRFLNKHAIIQIAMTGKGFCSSAHDAFFLMLRNAFRFSIVSGVTDVFVLIGTILITIISSGIGYIIIIKSDVSNEIYSPFYPLVCFVLLSYVISCNFMHVYGVASHTIIHCFCMDEEMHDDTKYAPKLLKEFMHHHIHGKKDVLKVEVQVSIYSKTW